MNFTGPVPSLFSDKSLTPNAELFRFLVKGVLPAEFAVFLEFEAIGMSFFVFVRAVIAIFAFGARQRDVDSHKPSSFVKIKNPLGRCTLLKSGGGTEI